VSDIFIVGPARSGTSWLQTMLAEHPDVASPPETGLFVEFLTPALRTWQQHLGQLQTAQSEGARMNVQGLATVLTTDDFQQWVRSLYDTARDRVLKEKPGATRLLEKTPDHAMCLDSIWQLVPDARVIFLVRDPRTTVRSMLQASEEPWGHWASTSVEGATDRWRRNARPALKRTGDERMVTVRYEDLGRGDGELCRIAEFLGLDAPDRWLRKPLDASPRDRQENIVVAGEAAALGLATYDLDGFSFHDRKQQRELTHYETAYVEWRCREEMAALGYEAGSVPQPTAFGIMRRTRFSALRARHYWRRYRKTSRVR
jgi:hypothetical protein